MPQTAKVDPKRVLGMYGESKRFIPLRLDLAQSAAFLTLKALDQMILIDFMGKYQLTSNFDRSMDGYTTPILYTFGMCRWHLSKNSFYRAMRTLQHHQFVIPYWLHKRRRGQAQRWLPQSAWKNYTPDQAELRLLNDYNDRRQSSIEDPAQMTIEFVTNLTVLNKQITKEPGDPESIADIIHKSPPMKKLFPYWSDPG